MVFNLPNPGRWFNKTTACPSKLEAQDEAEGGRKRSVYQQGEEGKKIRPSGIHHFPTTPTELSRGKEIREKDEGKREVAPCTCEEWSFCFTLVVGQGLL